MRRKEKRERERGRKKKEEEERRACGRYGALVARRRSRSFVAPTVEPSGPLRLSRRMKYTSTENGPRSWRRIDRDFRAPTFLPALTLFDHCRTIRRGVSAFEFFRRRILFIIVVVSSLFYISTYCGPRKVNQE